MATHWQALQSPHPSADQHGERSERAGADGASAGAGAAPETEALFAIGAEVRVTNTSSHRDDMGVVEAYDAAADRYIVRLQHPTHRGKRIKLKASRWASALFCWGASLLGRGRSQVWKAIWKALAAIGEHGAVYRGTRRASSVQGSGSQ